MRTVPVAEVQNAPKRSFSSASSIAQDFRAWYGSADNGTSALFRLGGKSDPDRDGNDAQLRDALCKLAGIARTQKLDANGSPLMSEKRGKPIFVAYSTADRMLAHETLGTEEREMGTLGDSRIVAIVKVSDIVATLTDSDLDDDDDDDEDN